jgi:ABC-2 type transport system permease protein
MSGRRAIFLTTRREIRERAASKAFLISTAVQIAVVVAIVAIGAISSGGDDEFDLGVDAGSRAVGDAAIAAQDGYDLELTLSSVADTSEARSQVTDGELDAAVADGRLISDGAPPDNLAAVLQQSAAEVGSRERLRGAGVPDDEIEAALSPPRLTVDDVSDAEPGAAGVAFVTSLLLYVAILGAGMAVATGVVEEKATRVVEVILSAIKPVQLLAGKVLGIGILVLGQLALTVAAGLLAALPTGALDLPDSTGSTVALIALFFVLGYALYACGFAVSGAMVSRQEDVQNSSAPLMMILIAGYLAAISVSNDPESTLAVACTFIPLVAPMVVPSRAAHDALPAGELVISILLMIAATALLLWLAARIYNRAALSMGAPLKFLQTLRLAR